ncbi:MAG: MarR family transcriptional regulator [Microbacteriaceae bacterium]|nr:MarR family transcriptional regulator [Microbacteriaceae bacterium]
MNTDDDRTARIREVLDGVASLSRMLSSAQRRPFEGRMLSGSQLSALFFLARNPSGLTPGRLAELLKVTAGAITQLIDGLRNEGHVDVFVRPEDARSKIVKLSSAAREEVEHFETTTAQQLQPRFVALSGRELSTLARLMSLVTAVEPL